MKKILFLLLALTSINAIAATKKDPVDLVFTQMLLQHKVKGHTLYRYFKVDVDGDSIKEVIINPSNSNTCYLWTLDIYKNKMVPVGTVTINNVMNAITVAGDAWDTGTIVATSI